MDKSKPILIIAPYEEMYHSALNISKKYDNVDVAFASLEDAYRTAKDKIAIGAEIIISRGGTYRRLKNSDICVPTVEIKISSYDILIALHKAKEKGKNICVIGFENIISGVQNLGPILDMNLKSYLITNKHEAEIAFNEAVKKYRADVVLGGSLAEKMAIDNGIFTVHLNTSDSLITTSIEESINILEIKWKEMEKTERYKAILNNINEGIISIGRDGEVIIFNPSAERIIGINQNDIVGKNVKDIFQNNIGEILMSNQVEYGKYEIGDNKTVLMNKVPISIKDELSGSVATFDDITKIQEYERIIRSDMRKKGHYAKYTFSDMIGNSKKLNKIKEMAIKYSKADSNIIIYGETGTGKEVLAQSIHNESNRCNGPFVALNCASIPINLIESELFGYSGGAFTDAKKDGKSGIFVMGHKGTVFLDEIGDTSLEFQTKLLRVIQEKEVRPIGSEKIIPIDVRIISATNKQLFDYVKAGKFRRDLYYRLNVLSLDLPTLSERIDDLELLSGYFLRKQNFEKGKKIFFTKSALDILKSYHWPGNIRELQNVMERVSIMFDEKVDEKDIIEFLDEYNLENKSDENSIKKFEKEYIVNVIKECGGNKTRAAEKLGISRTQLWRKMNNMNIN